MASKTQTDQQTDQPTVLDGVGTDKPATEGRRGRPTGSKNKPPRFTTADAFTVLTGADLDLTEEEVQGSAVKATGRTAERTEAQIALDSAVLAAYDDYVKAGKPEDVPGKRIVRFIPLAQLDTYSAMTEAEKAEVAEDGKALADMLYKSRAYIKTMNQIKIVVHAHGLRALDKANVVAFAYSVAEEPPGTQAS